MTLHEAELRELRGGLIGRDAEGGPEDEAVKEAEERERLRPTYAPLRQTNPVVDQSAECKRLFRSSGMAGSDN